MIIPLADCLWLSSLSPTEAVVRGHSQPNDAIPKLCRLLHACLTGGIGNARWTGILLRDVLLSVMNSPPTMENIEALNPQHVIFKGRDQHAKSKLYYESSIPLAKAIDPR